MIYSVYWEESSVKHENESKELNWWTKRTTKQTTFIVVGVLAFLGTNVLLFKNHIFVFSAARSASSLSEVTLKHVTRTFESTQSLRNHSVIVGPTAGNHTSDYLATKLSLNSTTSSASDSFLKSSSNKIMAAFNWYNGIGDT